MTLPIERSRSIGSMRDAVFDLLDHFPRRGGKIAKIPVQKLDAIRHALRHYPFDIHIAQSHKKLPDIWGPIDE